MPYAYAGVAGELDDMEDINEQMCVDCIAKYPHDIVGVKIRLGAQISNNGKHEHEAYRYC